MTMPEVSIIMITYNMGKYIGEAIESVLNQSYKNFELIILDDASIDNTQEIISQFDDKRIRVFQSKENKGIPYMRNWGIELMRGKYMAILDSDDIAPPYRIQEQYDYMEANPDIGVIGGDFFSFGEESKYHICVQGNENIQYRFLFRCPIANPAAMVRKSVIDYYNIRYDVNYSVCTDLKFWIEMLGRTKFSNLTGKPYLFYRVLHDESITTSTMKGGKIKQRDRIVKEMRRGFWERFGFKVSMADYDNFIKFFSYEKFVCTQQDFEILDAFMDDLIKQGKQKLNNVPTPKS